MARPATAMTDISAQVNGWDTIVDANKDLLEDLLFNKPYPVPLLHRATPDSGSVDFEGGTRDASDFKWCVALIVDPSGSNGYMVHSDGSDWIYTETGVTVT